MATQILAPLPGIFYRKPSPDQPPFVADGGHVVAGQTIGLVEAMKSFFPIEAEIGGTITYHVADGDPVDADQVVAEIG
jgi:biotin carboxyl carrier protein